MSGFVFADTYRSAGFNPGTDIVGRRLDAFNSLRKDVDASRACDLARLYFQLSTQSRATWFVDGFRSNDPTFTLVDNGREASILAGCLLSAACDEGNTVAALSLLASSAGGHREPSVLPEVVEKAKQSIHQTARGRRANRSIPPAKFDSKEADALAQAGDWAKAATLLKQLGKDQAGLNKRLSEDYDLLREEVDILWWFVGGWSRTLDQPFSEMHVGAAAVLAGLDFADLVQDLAGPVATPAILSRVLVAGRKKAIERVTLSSAVDALPGRCGELLSIPDSTAGAIDICPVMGAISKQREIGSGTAWHKAYTAAALFKPSATFDPLDLAIQVFRESNLLTELS